MDSGVWFAARGGWLFAWRLPGLGDINEKEFHDFIGEDMCLVPSTIDEAENVQMLLSPIWRSSYLEVRRIYGEEARGGGYGAVQVAGIQKHG